MPKCAVKKCKNLTRYKSTKEIYCPMHMARLKRHGTLELKKDSHELERLHALEKLPHSVVDDFIMSNYKKMFDKKIAKELRKMGFRNTTEWNVRYRRRQLGVKKYLYGEIKKHKAWIRAQAIKKYGNKCELCGYYLTIDAHHIIPKKDGGAHEIDNLMLLCPNCHALISRRIIGIKKRKDIARARKELTKISNSS